LDIFFPQYQGEMLQEGAIESEFLAGLLAKDNPSLQKLCLNGFVLRLGNAETLQGAFRNIPHLVELNLSYCEMDDALLRVITDGLVGNATLDILDISHNSFTANAFLSNVARLLESTRVKECKCGSYSIELNNVEISRPFCYGSFHKHFPDDFRHGTCDFVSFCSWQ
jgi:hypothetical protein